MALAFSATAFYYRHVRVGEDCLARAAIFAFETLRKVYVPETQAAVKTLNAAGDPNVYFVNTEGWLTTGDYAADGGHPNDQGQAKIASRLAPIITKVIGVPAA